MVTDTHREHSGKRSVMERATLIMDAFTDAPGHLLLEEITQITGLPRSTVFRMLQQLVELGWVDRAPRGYAPGVRITRHVGSTEQEAIRVAAAPVLSDLHNETRTVAHLAVLSGPVTQYLDKVGGSVNSTVPSRVGGRILAADAVAGRAMLAWLEPERVDRLMGDLAPNCLADLHAELGATRQRGGIAFSDGSRRPSGISSVAVAVHGPSGPVAAISLARRGQLPSGQVAPHLFGAARTVSKALFPTWSHSNRASHLRLA